MTTIRSDFLHHLTAHETLSQELNRAERYAVGPLGREAFNQVITEPLRMAGGRIGSPELIDRLIADTESGPGRLPLLSHSLRTLWLAARKRVEHVPTLRLEDYVAVGGVGGAVTQSADDLFYSLSEAQQAAARRMFLQLVHVGRGTRDVRKTATRQEILEAGGPEAETVLHRLSGGRPSGRLANTPAPPRLLVVHAPDVPGGQDERVDLVHDALVEQWKTFRGWLEHARRDLERREDLEAAAQSWQNAGKTEADLPSGSLIAYYGRWETDPPPPISPLSRLYVERGRKRERFRRRRGQAATVGLAVAAVLFAALGLDAWWNARVADRQKHAAQQALVEQIKATARAVNAETIAIDRTARAENAETIAAETVDKFFTTVSENALIGLAKAEPLRKKFLELSIKHLKELKAKRGEGPRIAARIAKAHFYVGRMHDRLGAYGKAATEFEAARDGQVALLNADPSDPTLRRDLAESTARLGLCYLDDSERKHDARPTVEQARDLLVGWLALKSDPPAPLGPEGLGIPALDFELAKTYFILGYLDKQSQSAYETGKSILVGLIARTKEGDPLKLGYEHTLAHVNLNLGTRSRDAGRAHDAGSLYRDAARFWRGRLELAHKAREEKKDGPPDEADIYAYSKNLVEALTNLVSLETARGKLTEAKIVTIESHKAADQFVRDFPYDDSRGLLVLDHLARGYLYSRLRWRAERQGDRKSAADYAKAVAKDAEAAVSALEPLARENPKDPKYLDDRGRSYLLQAELYAEYEPGLTSSNLDTSAENLDQALKIYKDLTPPGGTKNAAYLSRLVATWRLLGDTQATLAEQSRQRDKVDLAASWEAKADYSFRECLKDADDLITNSHDFIYRSQAGQHYCHAAQFLNRAHGFVRDGTAVDADAAACEAECLADRAIKVLSDCIGHDAEDDRARLYLGYAYQERALAQARLGNPQGAAEDAGIALQEAKKRAELLGRQENAPSISLLYNLAAIYARAAQICRGPGPVEPSRAKQADSYVDEALRLLEAPEAGRLIADSMWQGRMAKDRDFEPLHRSNASSESPGSEYAPRHLAPKPWRSGLRRPIGCVDTCLEPTRRRVPADRGI